MPPEFVEVKNFVSCCVFPEVLKIMCVSHLAACRLSNVSEAEFEANNFVTLCSCLDVAFHDEMF
jgi:hypothetical protein